MVNKFRLILEQIVKAKGAVRLFAVMKMDELTDKWSVIISAPWDVETNRSTNFKFINDLLITTLSPEEASSIARLGLFDKDEYMTQLFLKFNANEVIKDQKVNGFQIHEAHILASNPSL